MYAVEFQAQIKDGVVHIPKKEKFIVMHKQSFTFVKYIGIIM